MSKQSKRKTSKGLCWFLFLCYIALLVYFLFFAENYGRGSDGSLRYNLILFQEIIRFIKYHAIIGDQVVFLNLAGNIIGFMPFGFFLPLLSERERRLLMIVLLTFELSLIVEVIQLFTGRGSFDVDDLLLNTIGGILGYGCYCLFARLGRSR